MKHRICDRCKEVRDCYWMPYLRWWLCNPCTNAVTETHEGIE